MKVESIGVAQYFYHCTGDELPIRDILNRNGRGYKTEPHYENYTENWCSECMNSRIKSVNRNKLDYLFLFTRYRNSKSKLDGKLLVVGYLKRADVKRWLNLTKKIPSGVQSYLPDPIECGFFAGDPEKSRFVSAENGYELTNITNGRYIWYIDKSLGDKIIKKINSGSNIIFSLQRRVKELEKEMINNTSIRKKCNSC